MKEGHDGSSQEGVWREGMMEAHRAYPNALRSLLGNAERKSTTSPCRVMAFLRLFCPTIRARAQRDSDRVSHWAGGLTAGTASRTRHSICGG